LNGVRARERTCSCKVSVLTLLLPSNATRLMSGAANAGTLKANMAATTANRNEDFQMPLIERM